MKSVNESVSALDQRTDPASVVSDDLPFRGVVYYLVPERNFGVIVTADGLEIYFLRSCVIDNNFDLLEPGSRVNFDLSSSILGLQARHVHHDKRQSICH